MLSRAEFPPLCKQNILPQARYYRWTLPICFIPLNSRIHTMHTALPLTLKETLFFFNKAEHWLSCFPKAMEAGLVAPLETLSLLQGKWRPHVLLASLTKKQRAHIQILNSCLVPLPSLDLSLSFCRYSCRCLHPWSSLDGPSQRRSCGDL